jgi:hypothetical protein
LRPSAGSRRLKRSSRRLGVYKAPHISDTRSASLLRSSLRRRIETVTHLLACPEHGNDLLGDGHGFTRAWVTAYASLALLDREGAEAAKLNSAALCKSITDRVEDRIDDLLDVTLIQMRVLLGELVPGGAAVIENVGVGGEDPWASQSGYQPFYMSGDTENRPLPPHTRPDGLLI